MSADFETLINTFYAWMGTYDLSLLFLVLVMLVFALYMLFRNIRRLNFLALLAFMLQAALFTMGALILLERVMIIPAFEFLFILGGAVLPAIYLVSDYLGLKRRLRVAGMSISLVEKNERRPALTEEGDWLAQTEAPSQYFTAATIGAELSSPDSAILERAREQLVEAEKLLEIGELTGADNIYSFLAQIVTLNSRGLCNAGWIKHRSGQHDEAIHLFKRALAYSIRGKNHIVDNDGTKKGSLARQNKRAAEDEDNAKKDKRNPEPSMFARYGIACGHFALKEYEQALLQFQKALVAHGESAPLLRSIARCHLMLDNFEKAREDLENSLLHEDSAEARLVLAKIFLKLLLREGAVAQLEVLTATNRDMPEPWELLGNIYRKEEKWAEAEHCFLQLIRVESDNSEAWFRLGSCRRHLERYEEALSSFRAAIKLKPDHSRALYGAAAILDESGDIAEAVSLLRQSLAGDEAMAKTFNLLASILQREGRILESIAVYLDAVNKFTEDGLLHANLGSAQMMAGFYDRALKPFRNAVRLGENDSSVFTLWIKALFELKHNHEAVKIAREALAIHPLDAGLLYFSARAKARCNDCEGAITDLEAAVAIDNDLRLEARSCIDFSSIRTAPGFINLIRLPHKKN